jgi:anti-sigma B factor antagonist
VRVGAGCSGPDAAAYFGLKSGGTGTIGRTVGGEGHKRVVRGSFHARVEHQDASVVVGVSGEVDLAARDDFLRALNEACCEDGTRSVLVDLSGVSFCDSTGIKVLITAQGEAAARHIEMRVRDASPAVRRVFELAGVADLLERNPGTDSD